MGGNAGLSQLIYFGDPGFMYNYAMLRTSAADTYLNQLGQLQAQFSVPSIDPKFPTISSVPTPVTTSLPTLQQVTFSMPNAPSSFTKTLDIGSLLPAAFDATPPALNFPAAPIAFSEPVPTAPGINTNFNYPADLSITLPAPPSLLSISIAPFGGITLPTAPDSNIPELTAVAPEVVPYVPGALYASALLTELRDSLYNRIHDGTDTGLPPAVEQALWDRAREREFRAQADALADLDRMEALGYSLPSGVWVDTRIKIQTETEKTNAGLSREIAIKQAELHLANIQRALELSVSMESKMIDYANQTEQRALEAAKYATEAGVEIYNAKVRAYAAYLDAYKTKVQIYTAQIQAQVALVDAYKAQVEAERAKAEINTALVQQYKAQIDAALANIEIYKAQVDVIRTKAEIEKIKIEAFGEQVRAYVGKINAYTANVEAYRAQIQAEGTKQEAFKSRVQAYTAQVEAAVKAAEAKIEEYKGLLQAKTVEWEGYKAAISGEQAKAVATNAVNQTLVEGFKANVSAISAYNELLTKQWEASTNIAERVAEVGINAAKMNAELYMTTRQMAIEAAKVGAQVAAQLGASALNSIHWNSSAGNNVSVSESWTHSGKI